MSPRSVADLVETVRSGRRVKYLHFWGHRPQRDGSVGAGCLSQVAGAVHRGRPDVRHRRALDDVAQGHPLRRRPDRGADPDHFADGVEDAWSAELRLMTERRWFTPLGVRGAFRRLLPGEWLRHHDAVASVYAGFAHRIGWLHTERVLTPDKHAEMCAALPEWVADDRTVGDVLTRFGSPSVLLGGTNPRYPRTLLYAADPPRPLLCLHLWNDYDQPVDDGLVLLLAREDASPFGESCWFTPEGRRRRPTDD